MATFTSIEFFFPFWPLGQRLLESKSMPKIGPEGQRKCARGDMMRSPPEPGLALKRQAEEGHDEKCW